MNLRNNTRAKTFLGSEDRNGKNLGCDCNFAEKRVRSSYHGAGSLQTIGGEGEKMMPIHSKIL